jgi:hypothetical protein
MLPNYRLGGLSISFQSVVPCVTVLYKQLLPSPPFILLKGRTFNISESFMKNIDKKLIILLSKINSHAAKNILYTFMLVYSITGRKMLGMPGRDELYF